MNIIIDKAIKGPRTIESCKETQKELYENMDNKLTPELLQKLCSWIFGIDHRITLVAIRVSPADIDPSCVELFCNVQKKYITINGMNEVINTYAIIQLIEQWQTQLERRSRQMYNPLGEDLISLESIDKFGLQIRALRDLVVISSPTTLEQIDNPDKCIATRKRCEWEYINSDKWYALKSNDEMMMGITHLSRLRRRQYTILNNDGINMIHTIPILYGKKITIDIEYDEELLPQFNMNSIFLQNIFKLAVSSLLKQSIQEVRSNLFCTLYNFFSLLGTNTYKSLSRQRLQSDLYNDNISTDNDITSSSQEKIQILIDIMSRQHNTIMHSQIIGYTNYCGRYSDHIHILKIQSFTIGQLFTQSNELPHFMVPKLNITLLSMIQRTAMQCNQKDIQNTWFTVIEGMYRGLCRTSDIKPKNLLLKDDNQQQNNTQTYINTQLHEYEKSTRVFVLEEQKRMHIESCAWKLGYEDNYRSMMEMLLEFYNQSFNTIKRSRQIELYVQSSRQVFTSMLYHLYHKYLSENLPDLTIDIDVLNLLNINDSYIYLLNALERRYIGQGNTTIPNNNNNKTITSTDKQNKINWSLQGPKQELNWEIQVSNIFWLLSYYIEDTLGTIDRTLEQQLLKVLSGYISDTRTLYTIKEVVERCNNNVHNRSTDAWQFRQMIRQYTPSIQYKHLNNKVTDKEVKQSQKDSEILDEQLHLYMESKKSVQLSLWDFTQIFYWSIHKPDQVTYWFRRALSASWYSRTVRRRIFYRFRRNIRLLHKGLYGIEESIRGDFDDGFLTEKEQKGLVSNLLPEQQVESCRMYQNIEIEFQYFQSNVSKPLKSV